MKNTINTIKLKLHIAETEDFSPKVMSKMAQHFDLSTGPVQDLKTLLEEVDVFWFRLGYKIDASVLTSKSKCKILATPVTGIDHIDESLCKRLGIEIICLRGEAEFLKEVRATAEHTILLTMMLMRKGADAAAHTKEGLWQRDIFRGYELYKKKVGILGLGRLGYIVAEYFEAFGCSIYFYDIKEVNHKPSWIRLKSANEVVLCSDIISIHISYNKENHYVYGAEFFERFDDSKWLINTSRGGVIDETALIRTLNKRKIAGVALDVMYGEPDKINPTLIEISKSDQRIIITPHIGGNTYESFEKTEQFIAKRITAHVLENNE